MSSPNKWADRKYVLEAVKQDGTSLQYASELLKQDKQIVLEAIKQNGWALEYASDLLKKEREFILKVVREDGYALRYVDETLKKDREIVLEAVKQNENALKYANEVFKKDREIVLQVVRKDGYSLRYADETLRRDRQVVLEAVKQNENAFKYVHDSFKKDLGFVYSLFKYDSSYAIEFSPSTTKLIENYNLNMFTKLSNSNILEKWSGNLMDESDLYYCIELGSIFEGRTKNTIFNLNPTYSSMLIEKLLIFQILKQMNNEELLFETNSLSEKATYYLFCFRLNSFIEENSMQPIRIRDLKSYIEKTALNFKTDFYSKEEIQEIMTFAFKWLTSVENFDNYRQILSTYNELHGDLSKVFKALKYYYNYFKNEYDFITILGCGGEGVVFKVFHKESSSLRALKLKYDPEQSLESGNQTITLLKRNEIEGKITCFDCGMIHNHLYSVMEIGEESLSNYISRNYQIYASGFLQKGKLEEILEIFIKILNSVKSIHDHNILHRDLDPNNIVKVKDNYKIIDFETSRVVKTGNSITIGLGKYSYMSPEVSHDNYSDDELLTSLNFDKLAQNIGNITTSCDLFSLGCIFLKLLTNCTLQLDQQFVNDPDISKYGDHYMYFPGYGKYFYTVVTTIEGEMKLHYAIEKLINQSINPDLGVNNIVIRCIITMIQRDSNKRLDCYSHKETLENLLKYLRGEIQHVNITNGMKEIMPLRSYAQLIEKVETLSNENTKLVEKVGNLESENAILLERIKMLEKSFN